MKYIIDLDKLQHEDDICELEYYCQRYGTPLSEELEKIRADILSYKRYKDFSCMGTVYDFEIEKVFDNHIKELKGENNEH